MKPLYDPSKGTMQVAGLMSGSGTNLQKIIETELELNKKNLYPYHVAVIFTDNPKSNAENIGRKYNIPIIVSDIRLFYHNRGKPLKDLELRQEYDTRTAYLLKEYNISVAAYAGYMSIATKPLIDAFLGVNVHPADLSIKNPDGTRKYTGDHAVRDAILAREVYLRSTTHIIEEKVDYGKILMISAPMLVEWPEGFNPNDSKMMSEVESTNQARLKVLGDWKIFPKTILDISQGRFSMDEVGRIYHDEKLLFNGLRLEREIDGR